MKRFWRSVTIDPAGTIMLDGRPVRTPGRELLQLPTRALAEAIALEWCAVEDMINPRAMRLTGLANAAIDRVAPDHMAFALGLARYGESDLLYYRAPSPQQLIDLQRRAWDPILAWAAGRYDVHFEPVAGIVHHGQPDATLKRLGNAVAALSPFMLAPLSTLVTLTGSLIIALALLEHAIGADEGWLAAHVDEDWQASLWGEDAEALRARADARLDYDAAIRFLAAL